MDHPLTTHSLMQLSMQCQKIGLLDKALKYTTKCLYFVNIFGSEAYNDSIVSFVNLANIFQQKQQHQLALSCLFENLERSINIYGQNHFLITYIYNHIVNVHKEIGDLKKALEY